VTADVEDFTSCNRRSNRTRTSLSIRHFHDLRDLVRVTLLFLCGCERSAATISNVEWSGPECCQNVFSIENFTRRVSACRTEFALSSRSPASHAKGVR